MWGTVSDLKEDLAISAEHKLGERGEGRGQESHRSNDSQACVVNREHYRWQRGQNGRNVGFGCIGLTLRALYMPSRYSTTRQHPRQNEKERTCSQGKVS